MSTKNIFTQNLVLTYRKYFYSTIDIGKISSSTRGIYYEDLLCWLWRFVSHENRNNVALSKSCVVVENAFGRLKGRFQCLSKRLYTSVQKTVSIVATCCTLRNVCELKKQWFFEDWLQNNDIDLGENIPYPGICHGFGLGQAMRQEKIKNFIESNVL